MLQIIQKHRFLLEELVKRDFERKYKGALLGAAWSVMNPLLTLLIMRVVFGHFFGGAIDHYTIYLFCGTVVFSFFSESTAEGLLAQTLPGVEIWIRDDGSTDGTRAILSEYARAGMLRWYAGDNLGPAKSFWRLLKDCGDADFYAFCDQDDIWDADKLKTAAAALKCLPDDQPALYCGDVRVVDADGRALAERMVRCCPVDYAHALLRNLAPGCTYVFNRAARELLCRYDAERLGLELHDWTAYQLVACFGSVLYDARPHMGYRQHGGNAVGANRTTLRAYLQKTRSFWSGPMKNSRERQARRLEEAFGAEMSAEKRGQTALLAHYREDRSAKKALLLMLGRRVRGADGRLARLLARLNKL